MNKIPGEGQSMTRDAKQPKGSAPEMSIEKPAATFDLGGNDKPLSWENGEACEMEGMD